MRTEIIEKMRETSEYIFAHPELSLEERGSSHRLAEFLEAEGFRISWGTAGFDTAFTAEWGSGNILGNTKEIVDMFSHTNGI